MQRGEIHVQAHMSGQLPNQTVPQLSGLPQHNGSNLPSQSQVSGSFHGTWQKDSDVVLARNCIRSRILQLLQRQRAALERQAKLPDLARCLEEGLFKAAASKEEYVDLHTLELRLHAFVKSKGANRNQPLARPASSSSSIGARIPSPGMPHGKEQPVVRSAFDNSGNVGIGCNKMVPNAVSMESSSPVTNIPAVLAYGNSLNASNGPLRTGYRQAHDVFVGSRNILGSSIGMPTIASRMIPTPGLNNQQSVSADSACFSSGGSFSNVDSTSASDQQQPNHYVGTQNCRLHNLSGQIRGGMVSSMQQRPSTPEFPNGASGQIRGGMVSSMQQRPSTSEFPNGAVTGGLPLIGSNMHLMNNGTGPSESYMKASIYGNYRRPQQQHFDLHHQHQLIQSEGPMLSAAVLSGSGNLCTPATRMASAVGNQSMRPLQLQPLENLQSPQDHLLQSQKMQQKTQPSQFHQPPSQANVQIVHQHQQRPQNQHRQESISVTDALTEIQVASDNSGQVVADQGMDLPVLQPPQKMTHSQNNYHNLLDGSQAEHASDLPSLEKRIQEGHHQRIAGDEAQRPNLPLEGSVEERTASSSKNEPALEVPAGASRGPPNTNMESRKQQIIRQQWWLLFLHHARKCLAPKGKCRESHCLNVQELLAHIEKCREAQCGYPRCVSTRGLLRHHHSCRAANCPVCAPVKHRLSQQKALSHPLSQSGPPNVKNSTCEPLSTTAPIIMTSTSSSTLEASEDTQPPLKRVKLEHPSPTSLLPKSDTPIVSIPSVNQPGDQLDRPPPVSHQAEVSKPLNFECGSVKLQSSTSAVRERPDEPNVDKQADRKHKDDLKTEEGYGMSCQVVLQAKQEQIPAKTETGPIKCEPKRETIIKPAEHVASAKLGKPKIKGVSLTELFTPEQIREHITGLRQWVGQSKSKAEKNQAMEQLMGENSCQLCAVDKLSFEPPPIYCTPCGIRIKRNAIYYTMGTGDTRHCFCIPCYNEGRGENLEVDGFIVSKAKLEKKRNDEETEEAWVQCDKCEAWQHQICALFNSRRNEGGQAEYMCPNCYIQVIERGERKPLPQSAVLGAKDLPRTNLSDHMEQRLFRKLKQERQERAKVLGKSYDEVPGAEALVIRVVSSVDKKLEVKQRFLDIFQEENYPSEFPYKSKVILLFQKIEGVEVCLFGMYIQEFGSECQLPNQRRIYLSYLDSVKYFRPEIKTVTGEALRTFVYHEILIGYLEYCKKRGFTSCYIWACPPPKGEDYILYCHPEIQKTPKSEKLREWYLLMLRKAAKENIIVGQTNLHDHFFECTGGCKAKVTAARLPYFDGDYWPGAAEDMISQFLQEEEGRKHQKKGKTKKIITKRTLRAAGALGDLSSNASKDALLMHKLGDIIRPMKEDFIMVHLQHACIHCCHLMVSGKRWVCKQCENFQLCESCFEAEEKLDDKYRHPISTREKHVLYPVLITDVPTDTKDKDEILESEFFDTRQAFLSLCQGNHYQHDTLRRAKHSSMMVLYHLHNPTEPAFVSTCNNCQHDIEAGQGWRCEVCPDYDICNACYEKGGGANHPHKLTAHPSSADRDAQNKEARQERVLQLRRMLDLLVHAAQCRSPQCQYPNCRKVKGLFRHGIQCKVRASGGCPLCKKMWYLLQLHARACKESQCHVPRCRDLKEHLRRLQQQSESRRRAAVMEMMRQRTSEVARGMG
ncbi:hypothetical protein AMTRI_Chr04g242490 [Amborella trichopoda]